MIVKSQVNSCLPLHLAEATTRLLLSLPAFSTACKTKNKTRTCEKTEPTKLRLEPSGPSALRGASQPASTAFGVLPPAVQSGQQQDLYRGWEKPKRRKPRADRNADGTPSRQHHATSTRNGPSREEEGVGNFPANFDSRYGRAGEWPFVEDYAYCIVRHPLPLPKHRDPRLEPRVVPEVSLTLVSGWLPGFHAFPREIARHIFGHLAEDFTTVLRVRRVCKAWRLLVLELPVHVNSAWRSKKILKSQRILFPGETHGLVRERTLTRMLGNFRSLVALDLDEGTKIDANSFSAIVIIAPQLTALSFSYLQDTWGYTNDRLSRFTALEALKIRTGTCISELLDTVQCGPNRPPHLRLHTLVLETQSVVNNIRCTIGESTRFPALTRFSSLNYFALLEISNPVVYTRLTHLELVGTSIGEELDFVLRAPNLCKVNLRESFCHMRTHPTELYPAVTWLNLAMSHNIPIAFVGNFPALHYLDISGKHVVSGLLPPLPCLEVLRIVSSSPACLASIKLGRFPKLRRVIGKATEFIMVCDLPALGIELVHAKGVVEEA